MRVREQYKALTELPMQIKAITSLAIAALVIALLALGLSMGTVRHAN